MTSTDHNNNTKKLLQIIGQVDIFEDSTAGDTAISVFTTDGDEYVIVSRKFVKRLLRYAGEEIDLEFLGYVTHDASDGLDILNVVSFKPTSEEEIKATADYDRSHDSKKRKKAIDDELDDEDMHSDDFDLSGIHDDDLNDIDLDDEDLDLDDEEFDLDDADLDLSIINAIVKEVIEKAPPEPTEPAEKTKEAASPTEEPVATAKKNHGSRKADQKAEAATNHGQQTKNTKKKTADRPDKASDAKTPDKAEATKKDAKAKPAQKRKTPPPAAK